MTAQSYATTANLKTRLGITDSNDDTLLGTVVGAVNDWVEHYVGRPIGPLSSTTYTFDGYESFDEYRGLYIRQGIRTFTSGTIATTTGGVGQAITASDVVILPRVQDRRTGWPGFELRFIDIPTGPVVAWWPGYGNISITGDFGWAAIPPVITEVAEIIAMRAWAARTSGQLDIVGNDELGNPVISRLVSSKDMAALRDFRADRLAVG